MAMHPYGLSGGPAAKQPLLWQDRRDRSVSDKTEEQKRWFKFKKKSISESQPATPGRVFSMDKGVLGGRMAMNFGTDSAPQDNQIQLFHMENQDDTPSRPQLNLRDIDSQFKPLEETIKTTNSEVFLLHTPQSVSSAEELTPPQREVEMLHNLVHYQKLLSSTRQMELKTSSETDIIKPPSPFMDNTRRRPPPVPQPDPPEPVPAPGEGRQRRKLTASRPLSLSEHAALTEPPDAFQRANFVKDAVNLFEGKAPNYTYEATGELMAVKIPNKVMNVRQRSRGPSRTPSDPDLSRQLPSPQDPTQDPGEGSSRGIRAGDRLSKSYEFSSMDTIEHSHSRGRSVSEAASLDSLDILAPQTKEKKKSIIRGLINATRGKIGIDPQSSQEKSNTEPSRGKAKRSSFRVKPVRSEITMGELGEGKYAESATSSFGIKIKKQRKPRHLELQEGFDVKGFDNFMMY